MTSRQVVALPAGSINHHWTKSLVASPDGKALYVGVGSNSNAGENGLDAEKERNAVWKIDLPSGAHRVFANGLRNPVGLAWEPETGALWVSVNERDELGDHLPPDYMTAVRDGAFYGFPFSYYGQHVDDRVKPQNPEMVEKAIAPDYALGAHTASLGYAGPAMQGSRLHFSTACSSANMDLGTARHAAVIKSYSLHSTMASRQGCPSTC